MAMMGTSMVVAGKPGIGRVLPWAVRVATLGWAGFWAWFAVAVVVSEVQKGQNAGVPFALGWLVGLSGLTAAVWRWPRIGGIALIAFGIGAMWYFANPYAQMFLALPAMVIGGLSIASAYAGRPR
jgi:hypothetical protein